MKVRWRWVSARVEVEMQSWGIAALLFYNGQRPYAILHIGPVVFMFEYFRMNRIYARNQRRDEQRRREALGRSLR